MKQITAEELNNLIQPYTDARRVPKGWTGTVLDILVEQSLPVDVRVSSVIRQMNDHPTILRHFALICCQQAGHNLDNLPLLKFIRSGVDRGDMTLKERQQGTKLLTDCATKGPPSFAREAVRCALQEDIIQGCLLAAGYARQSIASEELTYADKTKAYLNAAVRQAALLHLLIQRSFKEVQ